MIESDYIRLLIMITICASFVFTNKLFAADLGEKIQSKPPIPYIHDPQQTNQMKYGWEICNNSSHDEIRIAVSHHIDNGSYVTRGWYHIKNNRCIKVVQKFYGNYLYFFAETKGTYWPGKVAICAIKDDFEYLGTSCPENYRPYNFIMRDVTKLDHLITNFKK